MATRRPGCRCISGRCRGVPVVAGSFSCITRTTCVEIDCAFSLPTAQRCAPWRPDANGDPSEFGSRGVSVYPARHATALPLQGANPECPIAFRRLVPLVTVGWEQPSAQTQTVRSVPLMARPAVCLANDPALSAPHGTGFIGRDTPDFNPRWTLVLRTTRRARPDHAVRPSRRARSPTPEPTRSKAAPAALPSPPDVSRAQAVETFIQAKL